MGWASRQAKSIRRRALGRVPHDPVGWAAVPMEQRAAVTAAQILKAHGVDVERAAEKMQAAK